MKKVLLIGARLHGNLGGPLILNSVLEILRKIDSSIVFTYLSPDPKDAIFAREYNINIKSMPIGRRTGIIKGLFTLFREILRADIVLDVWGLEFSDTLNYSFMNKFLEGFHYFIAKLTGKPIIKIPADMGPFNNLWNRVFAKIYLNMASLIFVRSIETKKLLRKLGIRAPIYVCPDVAFYCDMGTRLLRKTKEQGILIGVSISHTTLRNTRKKGKYLSLLLNAIEYLLSKYKDVRIVLIPNEVYEEKQLDDMTLSLITLNLINPRYRARIAIYRPRKILDIRDMRNLVRQCDLIIASRYHMLVLSLTECIPAIVFSWPHKYKGLMKLYGMEEHVYNINTVSFKEFKASIDKILQRKTEIQKRIARTLPSICQVIYYYIKRFVYEKYL